ncbi:hypothetical protein F5X99DRAFT_114396 [Biscogniauxia marginata]|nr:hypothetical protein F5X99DRAFT_114396 [Biscogniauxia marginata]
MDSSSKRKHDSSSGRTEGPKFKKRQGTAAGKWKTPHYRAKLEAMKGRHLEVGDMGIWTTCQRHKEQKAVDELVSICEEYGEKLYGIKPGGASEVADEGGDEGDIEASIKNEIEALKPANKPKDALFEPMRMNLDCLLFMRTRPPVDPIALVHEICKDASKATKWRSRFINKFTPITLTGKATEKGVEEVAREVLRKHFRLAGDEKDEDTGSEGEAYSYAIRPSFRAHNALKRDDVIKQVAGLIGPRHKVNLSTPDKVILIDIFQTFCGMSVVDGDWNALKKYNLHELYLSAAKDASKEKASNEGSNEEPKEEPTEKAT